MESEAEIRQAVAEQLGRRDVSDTLWTMLIETGRVDAALSGTMPLDDLVDDIRCVEEQVGARPRAVPETLPVDLNDDWQERDDLEVALSALLASEAARDPEVIAFRDQVLDGESITRDGLRNWIRDNLGGDEWLGRLLRSHRPSPWEPTTLLGPLAAPTARMSSAEWLDQLTDRLTTEFPWWKHQATEFVLTGRAPEVFRFRSTAVLGAVPAATRIVMEVDAAMTPVELANHYRHARHQVLLEDPQHQRKPWSTRGLRAAVFMATRPDDETASESAQAFRRAHPDQEAYTFPQNLRRDAEATRRRVLYPKIRARRS